MSTLVPTLVPPGAISADDLVGKGDEQLLGFIEARLAGGTSAPSLAETTAFS